MSEWNKHESERQYEMRIIQAGKEAEEKLPELQAQLKEFAEGATIGSANLLAIHYSRQIVKAEVEIMAEHDVQKRSNGLRSVDKDAVKRASDRIDHIKNEEIPLQEVMVEGFDDAYTNLTPITTNLDSAYKAIEKAHDITTTEDRSAFSMELRAKVDSNLRAKTRLLKDLDGYRKAGIKRPAQTPPQQ